MNYLEYHQKMINKQVKVIDPDLGDWTGYIREVKNEKFFKVERSFDKKIVDVDIYDVRSLENL